nr:MAG TPA: hypothetical protein [Caudoviricetes sp.]
MPPRITLVFSFICLKVQISTNQNCTIIKKRKNGVKNKWTIL